MSRLKYALIGHGRRGAAHLSTATILKDTFDVVAVCDAHAESAEAGAAKLGVKAYTDVRKVNNPRINSGGPVRSVYQTFTPQVKLFSTVFANATRAFAISLYLGVVA